MSKAYRSRDYHGFLETIRSLPTCQAKAEYIWEYYKYPIIGVIVGIVFIVSMVVTIYKNSAPVYLNGDYINVMVNTFSDTYDEDYLNKALLYDYLGMPEDTRTRTLYTDSLTLMPEDTSGDYASDNYNTYNMLTVHLAGHETDYFLLTENVVDYIQMQFECLVDLREFLTEEELEQYEDRLCYTSDGIPVGFDISDTQFVTDMNLVATDRIYLSWIVYSENQENFRPFFNFIMDIEAT